MLGPQATLPTSQPTRQVPAGKRVAYAANQVAINMLWQAFNAVAVYFYVTNLQVSAVAISSGMIAYGVLNALFNLLAGHISDRTHTRWGRRIPYIAGCSLPFALSFFFLFSPPSLGQTGLLCYFFVMTLAFDLSFTFTALNAGALYPEMFVTERDRAYVSALQQLFGIVGLIAGVALAKSLGETLGWRSMGLVFGAIGVLSMYVSLYGSFERKDTRESPFGWREALSATFRNRRFLVYVAASFLVQFTTTLFTSASSFYTTYVIRLTPMQNSLFLGGIFVVAMPLSFVWARAAVRFSSARSLCLSILVYALVELSLLVDRNPVSLLCTGLALGVPIAGFMVLLNVLLAEVIDIDAARTGRRREGMYLGVNGCIVRLGMSLQYAVMAAFFALSGYRSGAAIQSSGTILGFRVLLGLVPLIFLLAAFVFMLLYIRMSKERIVKATDAPASST
ncbi:MFS transporter [Alicyclobacillus tengchongensis]|nr:MFS transporter [Alicyclobacillus tengchongensis]